jgi:hypothetical protein
VKEEPPLELPPPRRVDEEECPWYPLRGPPSRAPDAGRGERECDDAPREWLGVRELEAPLRLCRLFVGFIILFVLEPKARAVCR